MSHYVRRTTRGKTVRIVLDQGRGPEWRYTYGNAIIGELAYNAHGSKYGYAITHIATGRAVGRSARRSEAERVCRVLGPHFTRRNAPIGLVRLTKQGQKLYDRLVMEGALVFIVDGHMVQIVKTGAMS